MKKLFCILTICSPLFLCAQSEEIKYRRMEHQIGFDATAFIKHFIVFNNSQSFNTNPFSFNYKALWIRAEQKSSMGIRAGLGFQNQLESSSPDDNTDRTIHSSSIATRLGFERQQVITGSWNLYYGLDILYTIAEDKAETIFKSGPNAPDGFKTNTRSAAESKGLGPIMGIQFNINKRLCLATEASFFFLKTTARFKSESTHPGAKNEPEDVTKIETLGFILPMLINFNIKL